MSVTGLIENIASFVDFLINHLHLAILCKRFFIESLYAVDDVLLTMFDVQSLYRPTNIPYTDGLWAMEQFLKQITVDAKPGSNKHCPDQ